MKAAYAKVYGRLIAAGLLARDKRAIKPPRRKCVCCKTRTAKRVFVPAPVCAIVPACKRHANVNA